MDAETRKAMNEKIDILFNQIDSLPEGKKDVASRAVLNWKLAKTMDFLGGGPMEARAIYAQAYDALSDLGLDVGGMIPPYRGI